MSASVGVIETKWPNVALGHLVATRYGHPFASENFNNDGVGVPVIRIRDVLAGRVQTWANEHAPASAWVEDGDVVIGMDGDFNHTLWSGGDAAMNQRVCSLHPGPLIDRRYLSYVIGFPLKRINETVHFTTVKHLSFSDLLAERVPVPPLDVQQRIADFLDAESMKIDRAIRANLNLASIFTERLHVLCASMMWERDSSPLHDAKGLSKIQYVTRARTGGATPRRSESRYWHVDGSGGVPWLTIGDLTRSPSGVRASAERVTEAAVDELALRAAPPGTLLYAMYASTGKVARLDMSAAHNQAILALWPDTSVIDPDYMLEWLRFLEPYVRSEARASTQPNLNAEQVGRLPVYVPPIPVQKRIVHRIDQERQRTEAVGRHLDRQNALLQERRQVLITSAVTGELEL